ncbi:MAG: DUF3275 family protein [Thiobacillus sp.]
MFKTIGTLVIKEIKGANGKFCVGDLSVPEGDFKVKEPILDQFEEGRYEGEFLIDRLYLSSYVWRGKSTTDIRAKLIDISLSGVEEGKQTETPSEPDPISTEPQQQRSTQNDDVPKPAVVIADDAPQDQKFLELRDLFGIELATLVWDRNPVKLDVTVDRLVFRRQRDLLKDLGYGFDATTQEWVMKVKEGV